MPKLSSWVLVAVTLLGVAGGCDGPPRKDANGGNSETHFLEPCDDSCAGGLACICGVCARACETANDCTALHRDATCVDACVGAAEPSVCDLACDDDATCLTLGAAFVCRDGFCRQPAETGAGGATGDAGRDNAGAAGAAARAGTPGASGGSAGGGGTPSDGGTSGVGASAGQAGDTGRAGASGATTAIAFDDLPRVLAAALCPSSGRCCEDGGHLFDEAGCLEKVRTEYETEIGAFSAHPGIAYDATVAADCIEGWKAAIEACTDRSLPGELNPACGALFYGTIPDGGPCEIDAECQGYDLRGVTCDSGLCTQTQWVLGPDNHDAKLDEPCGYTCDGDRASSVCVSASVADPPSNDICWTEDGLFCDDSVFGAPHVCRPIAAVDEPCPDSRCVDGAYCTSEGVCRPRDESGPCIGQYPENCVVGCNMATGNCYPLMENGGPCSTNVDCRSKACDEGICVEWRWMSRTQCESTAG